MQAKRARQIDLALALILRLALLSVIAWIIGLTQPVFDLGIEGAPGRHGKPGFETAFSWRDLILIAGGAFLCIKATQEIDHKVRPTTTHDSPKGPAVSGPGAAIVQIIALDAVFSVDSILTAIGMTDRLPIMVAAVIAAVGLMFAAAGSVTRFVNENPSVVMLALAFLLMIGMVLIADGFGRQVPKGYIYSTMTFAVAVEVLNMFARRRRARIEARSA